jgi:tetratricopeptide (TPR) repeat protein
LKLVFDWEVSSYSGWGVYGLNLALELARDPSIEARTSRPVRSERLAVDPLRRRALAPFLARSGEALDAAGSAWLHGLGNGFLPDRPKEARIGVVFFEEPLSQAAIERARGYELVVTGSSWNEEVLRAHGVANVRTILQGVDRSLFFPAPKRDLHPGRFLIFSGGKAEPRKGQDIVVAAFRIFAKRHPEAMLVTAWRSPWPQLGKGMDLDLSAFADRVIDVAALPNGHMGAVYRECDVALFPNRAEGGTNLVAMECLACGLPTILSDNTGHRDLIRMGLGRRLSQTPAAHWSEWGESDLDEVVDALEQAFAHPPGIRPAADLPQWSATAELLKDSVREVYRQPGEPALPPQALCQRGFALHRAGRLDEARACYEAVLQSDPLHFDALHLLGASYVDDGETLRGVSLLERAIDANPDVPEAHNNLAKALNDLKRHDEALACCDRAIALRRDFAEAHNNRGLALHGLRRFEEALASCDEALALNPGFALAHNNRGLALYGLERHEDAVASYDRAIELNARYAEPHNNRGAALRELKRPTDALASFDQAVAIKPDYVEAHNNRAHLLHRLKRHADALVGNDRVIALRPDFAPAHNNRGLALHGLGRLEEALASYDRAIALKPDFAEAFSNRGITLRSLKRPEEAIASYDQALALRPDFPDALKNRSFALLLTGQLEAGWRGYESRETRRNGTRYPLDEADIWTGAQDLGGRTLFVHYEQGLGDTLQFFRYVKLLEDRGEDVVVSVQNGLKSLLTPHLAAGRTLGDGERPDAFDFHCPMMSLPLAFGTTLQSIPAPERYICADRGLRARCEATLGPKTRPRVGIAWSGNPRNENDRNRSIAFERLAPLLDQDIEWFALQNQVRPGDKPALEASGRVAMPDEMLQDLAGTAALIDLMDLVVTVDTSIAHLAGAMGKPVWILLQFSPDWRWLLDRDDSPWYPSARLFRQPRLGDWAAVIEAVASELGSALGAA